MSAGILDEARRERVRPAVELRTEVSEEIEQPAWDAFVQAHPWGQFQQSTIWASIKAGEGWRVARLVFSELGTVVGGAQVLHRSTRFGRIGYIAKGPVVSEPLSMRVAVSAVRGLAKDLGLRCLVLQAPDFCAVDEAVFAEGGGQREQLLDIIGSTLAVDLGRPWEVLQAEMDKDTRHLVRQAVRRGVSVREGQPSELGLFFELMKETCHRQSVSPNPTSVEGLTDLWNAFQRVGGARLTFAVADGVVIAGLLGVVFGDRLTIWRKGWRNVDPKLKPNRLLYSEAIEWGRGRGLKWCDFGSLDRGIAEALVGGRAVPPEYANGRDTFHLSLGGVPMLFPSPYVYFQNPLLGRCYGWVANSAVSAWALARRRRRKRRQGGA